MNILCTICSDLVNQAENIHVTKCGHVFHHHCLAQWIERSKSCPQCRRKVTEKCMFRFYPTISSETNADDAATLQSRLDDAQLQLRQNNIAKKELDDKLSNLSNDLKKSKELIQSYEKKIASRDSAVTALRDQLEYLKIQNKETNRLKEENCFLHQKMQSLEGLERVLNETADDVEVMLQGYTEIKTIALFATALKRALCESESKKNELRDKLHSTKQELAVEKSLVANLQTTVMQLNDRIHIAKRKYEALKTKRKATSDSLRAEPAKQIRLSEPAAEDLDTSMHDVSAANMSSMVRNIEDADSPYFKLKHSSVAFALSNRLAVLESQIKPSEFAIINAARNTKPPSQNSLSIFHKKQPVKPDPSKPTPLDYSYDGFGGHSKLDTFPTPKPKVMKCVPKLTAKHKLKRPNAPTGSQDIGKLFEKISQE